MIAAIVLLVVAVLYRVLLGVSGNEFSWLPNFAPVAAIALCGPSLFPRRLALALPLAILLASDLVLNLHYGVALLTGEMLVRYGVLALIGLGGLWLRGTRRVSAFFGGSVAGSLLFYVVTNTASWLATAAYAKTVTGWWQALTVGIPGYPPTWMFLRNALVGDIVFTGLCLGCLALARHCPEPREPAGEAATRG